MPAGMLSVLAKPGLVLLGLSPPTVAATAPQLLCLTLTVISQADFLGSNQATSVVNPVTFKCRPERNAELALLSLERYCVEKRFVSFAFH